MTSAIHAADALHEPEPITCTCGWSAASATLAGLAVLVEYHQARCRGRGRVQAGGGQ